MGRKEIEILQEIEEKDKYHTSFGFVRSSTSILDSNRCKWICHGCSLDEMR
jgi:hypothetical protein